MNLLRCKALVAMGTATNHAGQVLVAAVSAPVVQLGQNNDVPGVNTMQTFLVDGSSVRELPPFTMPASISGTRVHAALDAAGNVMLL